MEAGEPIRWPIVVSVLIVAATMIAICVAGLAAIYAFDFTPSNSSGNLTTLISTIAGGSWLRRKINRPMSHRERLGFATGVMLVNAVVPVGYIAVLLWWVGLPVSLASFDSVVGGGKGYFLEPAFAWLMLFILGLVFVEAYFFGWVLTRKRRKTADAAQMK